MSKFECPVKYASNCIETLVSEDVCVCVCLVYFNALLPVNQRSILYITKVSCYKKHSMTEVSYY